MKTQLTDTSLTRRDLLGHAALGTLAMVFPGRLLAQQTLTTTMLRNDLHLIAGAGAHVLVAVGPDAVVVVDGGLPAHAPALLAEIERLAAGKPVAALFNSNWRPEHCGLNHAVGPRQVRIIAHENTRLWQGNDFTVAWEDFHHAPVPAEARANDTFYEEGQLPLGSETVAYGRLGPCHTDGDIYVHFRNANVLFAGDALTVGTYPVLDYVTGGWITGARESTDQLLALADADTLVVPSAGPVQSRQALEDQAQMLAHAYDQVANAYRTGRSLEQFRASQPMADFTATYGDPALFEELLYRGAWYHVTGRAIPGII